MDLNLFTILEEKQVKTEEASKYQEILEKRVRPALSENSDDLMLQETEEQQEEQKPETEMKIYTFDEAYKASIDYFKGDDLAAKVWASKYSLKKSDKEILELNPDEMHRRLAKEVARIEKNYKDPRSEEELYQLFRNFKYIIPQGSPMAGIGNNFQVSSLSNCFVIGNKGESDSYGGIMKIDQEQVQLMKRRGGVGHDLTHIRPKGSPVKNSALTSTGVVPFMERYSNSTREVAQDGRRGALMLSISVKHPDSEDFIDAKMSEGKVTGANISVKIDDEFMQAVKEGKTYVQKFPIDSENPTYQKEIDARTLWNKIIHNAWSSAEPGVIFWDTVIRESVPDSYADLGFKTVSTNPCGEIPLCPYDSCRLLAINLYSYVDNPFTRDASFNFGLFSTHAGLALRIMDDIIDLEIEKIDAILNKINSDPEEQEIKHIERNLWENIRQKCVEGRRTGIGITAEGDMLAALGLRYGTQEANDFSTNVHKSLALNVYRSSVELARERGPFKVFDYEREKNNPFIQRLGEADPELLKDMKLYGRRNIAMLTIAPTGSVSICTQTTSGIEPVFRVSYKRRRKVNPNDQDVNIIFTDKQGDAWEEFVVFHPKFLKWLIVNGYNVNEVKKLPENELAAIIEKSPYYKATSDDIDWVSKVKMQGDVQKWVDHSISVTVNLPNDATKELVSNVYTTAWEVGCKGMTIYREGSRDGVLISNDKKTDNPFAETHAPTRPKVLDATVVRFKNSTEDWVSVVGLLHGRPYEVFSGSAKKFFLPDWVKSGWVTKNKYEDGKNRYDFIFEDEDGYKVTVEGLSRQFNKEYWNYAKLISGILRHGMPLQFVIDVVKNLNVDSNAMDSWKKGVVRALSPFVPDNTPVPKEKCDNCGAEGSMMYTNGCHICSQCGATACD